LDKYLGESTNERSGSFNGQFLQMAGAVRRQIGERLLQQARDFYKANPIVYTDSNVKVCFLFLMVCS
jgi:hypothetical protein